MVVGALNRSGNLRPDRVMTDGHQWIVVDFKFGQRNDSAYSEQVGVNRQEGGVNGLMHFW